MSPSTPRDRWVVFPRPNAAARLRLFCFPYAGGGASVYNSWARGLPADVEVCAVQPPGREQRLREAPFTHVDALVESAAVALAPFLDMPFAFYGHSMGAVAGFELIRRLRREGLPLPLAFFPSGRPAPHLPSRERPIHDLPEDEFRAGLRRLRGTPDELLEHPELMELFSPLLRADFAVSETYTHRDEPPLDMPISAFGGMRDEDVSQADVVAWRQHTTGAFEAHMFPGDHFFIRHDQDAVLAQLSRELRRIR